MEREDEFDILLGRSAMSLGAGQGGGHLWEIGADGSSGEEEGHNKVKKEEDLDDVTFVDVTGIEQVPALDSDSEQEEEEEQWGEGSMRMRTSAAGIRVLRRVVAGGAGFFLPALVGRARPRHVSGAAKAPKSQPRHPPQSLKLLSAPSMLTLPVQPVVHLEQLMRPAKSAAMKRAETKPALETPSTLAQRPILSLSLPSSDGDQQPAQAAHLIKARPTRQGQAESMIVTSDGINLLHAREGNDPSNGPDALGNGYEEVGPLRDAGPGGLLQAPFPSSPQVSHSVFHIDHASAFAAELTERMPDQTEAYQARTCLALPLEGKFELNETKPETIRRASGLPPRKQARLEPPPVPVAPRGQLLRGLSPTTPPTPAGYIPPAAFTSGDA